MAKSKITSRLNENRYLKLANQVIGPTYPVSVDHTFLMDLLNIEKLYANDKVIMFRRQSHPIRKFHVTGMSLRVMMTIFRRFNTEGALVGVPIHRLYCLMNEEYETKASKEQFYAEIQKFIDLGLISVSNEGIVSEWRIESFKRENKRFVLFNPLVFTKGFTELEVAAQKLYLYIVSRNGIKTNVEFKEYLDPGSWIYTLTHKSRPAQIKELMRSLSQLEPIRGQQLLFNYSVEKDSFGRWSIRCVLNPSYLVKHIDGAHYRMVPKAKIPYSKTVSRLRMLFKYNGIGEVEQYDGGRLFLHLTKILHNISLKTIRFAVSRIKEMLQNSGYLEANSIILALQEELRDRNFMLYIDIAKATGLYRYLGMGEDGLLDNVRPFQFFRAIKDAFSLKDFRRVCITAVPILKKHFGDHLIAGCSSNHFLYPDNPDEPFFVEYFLLYLDRKETNSA